ncbi:restriction endonuclease subunit S [Klebsiella quasipneumoniae]|uniref:restriction endonuclease subunit S n=3 Tax=Klebsiella quasipneumoniae TaxID=1463165 RepID=UPI00244A53B3|nr:restriction endonuclease subunit S [Klebsiella quasipneumoniae]MDH2711766.1 restriction endonuclease subunit S [Klebsiella quasipneumoniae]
MGSKWATVSIDDIKLPEKYSCVGGPFGSSLSQKHYVDSGVPVIRGTNLAGDIFSESDFVFVSPDKANELQRNMAFRGDIVFTQRGTLGQVALIPEDSLYEKYIVSQSQMKLTVNPKQADAYFIYTYFRTNEAKALIENNAIVGGVPHINLGILKEFKLRLPPLSEQKRISEVSKSIDNKINLNRQINQTLEQMSQTLFKSWFVDFDPVIDNALDAGNPIPESLQSRAELRQKVRNNADFKPLSADIRVLFPAEFEEVELGWVPKGWKISTAGDELVVKGGSTPSTSNADFWENGTIHWTSPKDLTGNDSKVLLDTSKKITELGLKKISSGLLPTDTVLMSSRAPIGYLALAKTPMAINQGYIAIPSSKNLSPEYIIYWLENIMDDIKGMAGGTTFAEISKSAFKTINLVIPSKNIVNEFTRLAHQHFEKVVSNTRQITVLTTLRDTLLPKLISGELSLEDLPDLVTQTEPA